MGRHAVCRQCGAFWLGAGTRGQQPRQRQHRSAAGQRSGQRPGSGGNLRRLGGVRCSFRGRAPCRQGHKEGSCCQTCREKAGVQQAEKGCKQRLCSCGQPGSRPAVARCARGRCICSCRRSQRSASAGRQVAGQATQAATGGEGKQRRRLASHTRPAAALGMRTLHPGEPGAGRCISHGAAPLAGDARCAEGVSVVRMSVACFAQGTAHKCGVCDAPRPADTGRAARRNDAGEAAAPPAELLQNAASGTDPVAHSDGDRGAPRQPPAPPRASQRCRLKGSQPPRLTPVPEQRRPSNASASPATAGSSRSRKRSSSAAIKVRTEHK